MDRKSLRKQMRELRRSLLPEDQARVAKSAAKTALNQSAFPLGESIALYMAADGEIDTGFLLQTLLDQGKNCYLPVLVEETTTLIFRQFLPDKPMLRNFYGLLEPEATAPAIAPEDLSCVFMPLVAFDDKGNRLGMGKGYYDRTFAFVNDKSAKGPELIGLAHECQRVENLEAADWDVPLGGIITGQQFYQVR
ncbi:MAG: 5-formyltetrahydrofolate cyclo-ligase [Gammaproteobacteria bacterium]|jgi:5-formyltetrahydrofolate cyclo-ligase|nr:5-formyltetrahydrofolate cyclo-ligase [Gammaproteobacteria bacterium]MBT6043164.1 5-formyltetrahydrofolate cyclo-ligase [Gammaproteobacteria bacterium]